MSASGTIQNPDRLTPEGAGRRRGTTALYVTSSVAVRVTHRCSLAIQSALFQPKHTRTLTVPRLVPWLAFSVNATVPPRGCHAGCGSTRLSGGSLLGFGSTVRDTFALLAIGGVSSGSLQGGGGVAATARGARARLKPAPKNPLRFMR